MSADDRIKLEPGWKEALREEFDKPYMQALGDFLRAQKAAGRHRIGIRRRRERLIFRPCRSAPPRACASRAWRITHARA